MNSHTQKQIDSIRKECEKIRPLLVIRCLTYNHEPYIRDTLEGFVSQKTNFPFVAIVHDDASTDATAAIVQEYAEKYPDIIKPIFETENQYSKKDGSITKIVDEACAATGAKYVAICEGDDYWIDLLKLQKQVNFLEAASDYTMCFHPVEVKVDPQSNLSTDCFSKTEEGEYKMDDILTKWTIPTCSVVLRREMLRLKPENENFQYGDNVLWLTCASNGKIYCINRKMGVYRRQPGGWMSQDSLSMATKQYLHCIGLKASFPALNNQTIDNLINKYRKLMVMAALIRGKLSYIKIFVRDAVKYKRTYAIALVKSVIDHFAR